MKKSILFILSLIVSIGGYAAVPGQYTGIYRSLKNRPVGELSRLGEACYRSGSLDSALVCYSIVSGACRLSGDQPEKQLYAHAFNRCGVIYMHHNSYSKAMNLFLKSLEICEGTPYSARVYNNISYLYCIFCDYKTAGIYSLKAYRISSENGDKRLMETILYNLIGIQYYLEEYAEVKRYVDVLGKLKPQDGWLYRYHWHLSNGALNFLRKNYTRALSDFKASLRCAAPSNMPGKNSYISLSHISKCFSAMNRADSALYYIKRGEKVLRSHGDTKLKAACYANMASIYNLLGNEKQSLSYKKRYLELADSIFNVREFGQMKDMQFVHEMEKIEKQVSHLTGERILKDHQIESQQQALAVFIAAMAVILALLVIMFIQVRRLREANLEIFHRNLEIMESEEKRRKQRRQPAAPESVSTQAGETLTGLLSENAGSKTKYQGSFIGPEEKTRIREAILDVMDNTQEYCSVNFTLDKLAALIHAKPKHISQIINESFQKNFNMFVNEYRIKEVQRRLMDADNYGKYTLVFIAASVGFRSDSNFNAVFKKITGMTPTAYRNMVNKCRRAH